MYINHVLKTSKFSHRHAAKFPTVFDVLSMYRSLETGIVLKAALEDVDMLQLCNMKANPGSGLLIFCRNDFELALG